MSKLVSPGSRRTLRDIAKQGVKRLTSSQVILVRSDSTSDNSLSSSSSSSPSSKPTPRAGSGNDGGANGRRSQGHNGSKYGGGDGGGGGFNPNKMGSTAQPPSLVAEAAAAGVRGASGRRHSNSARKSGRIACSGGQRGGNGLRVEHGARPVSGRGEVGISAGDGSEHDHRGNSNGGNVTARAIDVRRRLRPMLVFHLLVGIVVRSTQWARQKKNRPA